jgi:hypothetical protein
LLTPIKPLRLGRLVQFAERLSGRNRLVLTLTGGLPRYRCGDPVRLGMPPAMTAAAAGATQRID